MLTARWALDYVLLGGVIVIVTLSALAVSFEYYHKKVPIGDLKLRLKRKTKRKVRRSRIVSERTVERATVSKETTTVPAPLTPTRPEKLVMFCPQCGAKITRDSKFCKECGAKT